MLTCILCIAESYDYMALQMGGHAPGIAAAGGAAGKTTKWKAGPATSGSQAAAHLVFTGKPTTAESPSGAHKKNRENVSPNQELLLLFMLFLYQRKANISKPV